MKDMNLEECALMVGRFQPLHKGHTKVIQNMIEDNKHVVIGIGSKSTVNMRNPFSFSDRITMLYNVFGMRVRYVGLEDLNTSSKEKWCNYVMDRVQNQLGLRPEHFYSGSLDDADYFSPCFDDLQIVERDDTSATRVRNKIWDGDYWKENVPQVNRGIVERVLNACSTLLGENKL